MTAAYSETPLQSSEKHHDDGKNTEHEHIPKANKPVDKLFCRFFPLFLPVLNGGFVSDGIGKNTRSRWSYANLTGLSSGIG